MVFGVPKALKDQQVATAYDSQDRFNSRLSYATTVVTETELMLIILCSKNEVRSLCTSSHNLKHKRMIISCGKPFPSSIHLYFGNFCH